MMHSHSNEIRNYLARGNESLDFIKAKRYHMFFDSFLTIASVSEDYVGYVLSKLSDISEKFHVISGIIRMSIDHRKQNTSDLQLRINLLTDLTDCF